MLTRAAPLLLIAACGRWPWSPTWHAVRVPAGTYLIGSPPEELGHDDGEERRPFTVTQDLWMSATEVPQGLFIEVVGHVPACHAGARQPGDDLPMHCVSREEAFAFCAALSARDALPPDRGWRLPTEHEWEVAARAGGDDAYAGTSDPAAACAWANVGDGWGCDDGWPGLAPVGRHRPNAWGLYDMTGNVREWTDTVWQPTPSDPPAGPVVSFVDRGGSWSEPPATSSVADRDWGPSARNLPTLGFRVVRPAD